jgi:hypothetical protein
LRKSFTAKVAKETKENNSFTAKDAKDTKVITIERSRARSEDRGETTPKGGKQLALGIFQCSLVLVL